MDKLVKEYRFGFEVWGLVLFIGIMLPNFVWFAVPAPMVSLSKGKERVLLRSCRGLADGGHSADCGILSAGETAHHQRVQADTGLARSVRNKRCIAIPNADRQAAR